MLNNYRISHWCAGALVAWTGAFVLFGLPIFYLWLEIPIKTIAAFFLMLCVVQLAVTPWLFSARSTPQNPVGNLFRRRAAVIVWFSLNGLVLAYFMLRGSPPDAGARAIFIGLPVVLGTGALIALALISSRKRAKKGPA
jgi:hypothetical protein